MKVNPLLPRHPLPEPGNSQTLVKEVGNNFSKMFNEVNQMQLQADQKIEEFATSPAKDVHGTMIALQQAEVSLKLLLQVRSKLTNAYLEIMRTQL